MKNLIVVLDNLGQLAHDKLLNSGYDISFDASDIKNATALIVRSSKVDKDMIDSAPSLKIISRAGVGLDSIDIEYANQKGIKVFNSAGGNSVNAAETTIGLILSLAHKISYAHHLLYGSKIWERGIKTEGFELEGKTLGIIGCGNVGSRVALFALAFNMNVLIFDPYIEKIPTNTTKISSLEELLSKCDILTIHTPLTQETYHLINEKNISLMKNNSYLINASRGKVVEEQALIKALKNKKLAGAALDVFEQEPLSDDSELFNLENIIIIPHLGGASIEARTRVSDYAVENVLLNL